MRKGGKCSSFLPNHTTKKTFIQYISCFVSFNNEHWRARVSANWQLKWIRSEYWQESERGTQLHLQPELTVVQVKQYLRSRATSCSLAKQAYEKHKKYSKYKTHEVQLIVKVIEDTGYDYPKMASVTGKTEAAVSLVWSPVTVTNHCLASNISFTAV